MQLTTSWMEEGQQNLLLRQLRRRFGEVPPGVEDRIRQLPVPKLEETAKALLDFAALRNAEVWLESHTSSRGPG